MKLIAVIATLLSLVAALAWAAPTPVPTPAPVPAPEAPAAAPSPAPPAPNAPEPNAPEPNAPEPNAAAESLAQSPGAPVPAAPPMTTENGIAELEGFLEPFLYDVNNRRDPFTPYAEYTPTDDAASARALSPAQRWDLDKLKLIGIMWDIKDPKAMFLDPDQDVMILGRDESIGNKNGYIAAVREGEVLVVESVRTRGDLVYRTRVLRIER